jgi:hypothetical protein
MPAKTKRETYLMELFVSAYENGSGSGANSL